MADLAEILIVEHLSIRHIREVLLPGVDFDAFLEFDRYLRECHIEIEEKLLFPLLKEHVWPDNREFSDNADRIMADHRLLRKLSSNLIEWHESGDLQLFKERFPLYFRLLLDHNEKEETSVFPRWAKLEPAETGMVASELESVVESFGVKDYLKITKLTPDGFRYLFHK